jgi:hypothetical protein
MYVYVVCSQSSLGFRKSALPLCPSALLVMYYQLQLQKCFKCNIISFSALNLKFSTGNESVCIDIYISENKSLPYHSSVFYDCAWYSERIEGNLVILEYVAKGNDFKEVRKFSFIAPTTKRLGKGNRI